jgi:cytochrome c biogenesis protein
MTSSVKARPARPPAPRPEPNLLQAAWNQVRRAWRRLVSMRTALILLFLLAVASVPGSLLPQRPLNPSKVDSYLLTHGGWGRFLDRLGFFDVFGTPWFAAIYLLLGISLIGCLIPRIRLHARNVRSKPLPAPKHLARLPESDTFTVDGSPEDVNRELRRALGRRWRTIVREDTKGSVGGWVISAEKGYLRETGNLVFHVALLVSLVAIAAGRLWGYSASVVVVQGSGFCNTVQQYDSWRPGRFEQDGNVAPFCIDSVDKFTATYLATGEPSKFATDVTYHRGVDGPAEKATIRVNHPLRIEGDRVYLIGHGYAPHVSVTMPDGSVQDDTASFIPQNPNTFYSEGAFMFPARAETNGSHKNDIGISGFFAPTPAESSAGVFTSTGPEAVDPVLGIFVYQGDLGFDGQPKSVYSLDANQITTGKLNKIGAANLRVGESTKLANGVTVKFDGWVPWVSMQVSHDPTQGYLLVSASLMVIGLIGSLSVRRRRVWIRTVSTGPDPKSGSHDAPRTVVEVGGLARSDSGNFTDEFAALTQRLRTAVSTDTDGQAQASSGAKG